MVKLKRYDSKARHKEYDMNDSKILFTDAFTYEYYFLINKFKKKLS